MQTLKKKNPKIVGRLRWKFFYVHASITNYDINFKKFLISYLITAALTLKKFKYMASDYRINLKKNFNIIVNDYDITNIYAA